MIVESVVDTAHPNLASSVASAATRFDSFTRSVSSPRILVVPRASAEIAHTLSAPSGHLLPSRSMPRSWSVPSMPMPPGTVISRAPIATSAAMHAVSGCREVRGNPRIVARASRIAAAAARKYTALLASGSTATSAPATRYGSMRTRDRRPSASRSTDTGTPNLRIVSIVSSTYDALVGASCMTRSMPCCVHGAISSSALRNWLDAVRAATTVPPRTMPPPPTSIGRRPSASTYCTRAPAARRRSTPSATGRSRSRALPSTSTGDCDSAPTASMNRAGAPPSPRCTRHPPAGDPHVPRTDTESLSHAARAPAAHSASRNRSGSRARSGRTMRDVPSASAASAYMRFVSLLDPGGTTSTANARRAGITGQGSGSDEAQESVPRAAAGSIMAAWHGGTPRPHPRRGPRTACSRPRSRREWRAAG